MLIKVEKNVDTKKIEFQSLFFLNVFERARKKAPKCNCIKNPVILSNFDQNDLVGSNPKAVANPKTKRYKKTIIINGFILGLYLGLMIANIIHDAKAICAKAMKNIDLAPTKGKKPLL